MRNVTNGEALELLDMISELLRMIQDLNEKDLVAQRYIRSVEERIDSLQNNLG